jgi:hypothetical protein
MSRYFEIRSKMGSARKGKTQKTEKKKEDGEYEGSYLEGVIPSLELLVAALLQANAILTRISQQPNGGVALLQLVVERDERFNGLRQQNVSSGDFPYQETEK